MAHNDRNMTPGGLVPLDEADDYKVADGNPDPRGWDVIANGTKVGEVDKLIADLSALKVRYLDVELDDDFAGTKDRHVLIPIGAARLDDDNDEVLLQGMTREALIGLPAFAANTPITRDYENSLRERMTGAPIPAPRSGRDYYDHEHFDENRFFGKRQVQAGEVDVRKTVETKHVEQPVTRRREEVEVERRPIQGDQPVTGAADIKEGETRIPLMEEEIVVEKRPVAKEEVVIRKHAVEDTENVGADLKKERVDVDEKGRVRGKVDRDRDADENRRAR
jgi:uncharacterized protein (TIGR02271 family)